MATIPSTRAEFFKDAGKFFKVIGDTSYTQEQVVGAYRALVLRYLGLQNVTDQDLEECAMILKVMVDNAEARGWDLQNEQI